MTSVKLQHNIAPSLPPWLNATLSLRDRSTHMQMNSFHYGEPSLAQSNFIASR